MNDLEQAVQRLQEAHAAATSLVDYLKSEGAAENQFSLPMAKEALGKLATISAAQSSAIALVIRHLGAL